MNGMEGLPRLIIEITRPMPPINIIPEIRRKIVFCCSISWGIAFSTSDYSQFSSSCSDLAVRTLQIFPAFSLKTQPLWTDKIYPVRYLKFIPTFRTPISKILSVPMDKPP
jgi:hypothetical protein